ncbi:hypothetical protein M5K25_024997 [Dendrobium thyrsiflorum]|uniref:Uncharacterized protein n=1 Tax=Dendrobium thyrsiflorum TaxID=117978 RepID=A0ABD0U386_DENTH
MSKYAAGHGPTIHFSEESSFDLDTHAQELTLSWGPFSSSSRDNQKPNQVVPHDVIEIDDDDNDQDGVVIIGENLSKNKNRQPMKYGNGCKNVVMMPVILIEDEIDVKFHAFKQFGTVRDYSDHHFKCSQMLKITPAGTEQPSKDWAKRIQHEWKSQYTLEFMKSGWTFFVLLSLDQLELHIMMVSFFLTFTFPNFPMIPPHFEDFVAEHFRSKGRSILAACRAYIQGAQIGCIVGNGVQVDKGDMSRSSTFKQNLSALYDQLVMQFAAKGVRITVLESKKKAIPNKT